MDNNYIAKDGLSCIDILVDENAGPQGLYAADELRYYLSLITAAQFEIVKNKLNMPAVILQYTDAEEIGEDGFSIRSAGKDMIITGGKRGIIYGVYELLEKLGCRFFTALCEKIPIKASLLMPVINETHIPVLEYREHNYADAVKYTRFAVKCRLNGAHHKIREKHGGHMSYAWYVHTFQHMVPPEKYATEHPEYYALVNGKRPSLKQRFQLCLSNPEVLKISIDSARDALIKNPKARIISISQNDWHGNCTCDDCKRIDNEEGSPAGLLLRFVNAIAETLEPEFPGVIFDTLAYMYTRPAPKITKPRHNVCVRLCSIECCFSHSLETCDDNKRAVKRPDGSISTFMNDLRDWGKICNRMYIWDYTTCFAHYPTPHPNWNTLQPNMKAFVQNNVKGVFEQANGSVGGGVDLNELRLYLISKLLWNPNTDLEKHMTEFLEFYYGKAAPFIRKYIDVQTKKVEKDNIHVGFNDNPIAGFLSEDMLDIYAEIYNMAKEAVKDQPLYLYRVAKAELSIRYVRLKRKSKLQGIVDPQEIRDFFTDWQSFGLTRIDEWVSSQTTHRALLAGKWRGTEFYGHWTDEGGEEL